MAAWYDGNSTTTLRERLAPSGFSNRPARTMKRAPKRASGAALAATQRNLSERGRDEARAAGARLRAERIAIARVLSSPWCRCVDTATLVGVGPVQVEPAFANAFVLHERRDALREGGRAVIGRWRGPGVLFVVTHGENIRALTGRSPATAEIVVVSMGAEGAIRDIGSLPAPARLR